MECVYSVSIERFYCVVCVCMCVFEECLWSVSKVCLLSASIRLLIYFGWICLFVCVECVYGVSRVYLQSVSIVLCVSLCVCGSVCFPVSLSV